MKLLKPTQVMNKLSVSRTKVYEMIKKGIIPSVEIDGCIRVPEELLDEMIRRQIQQRAGKLRTNVENLHILFGDGAGRRTSEKCPVSR